MTRPLLLSLGRVTVVVAHSVPDLLLTFPASASYVAPVRAAVSGYAARFVEPTALAAVTLAVGEAAGELVDGAGDGAALVVEVRRTSHELVVRLAREGPAAPGRGAVSATGCCTRWPTASIAARGRTAPTSC